MKRKIIFCCVVTFINFCLISFIFSFFCRAWLIVALFSVLPAIIGTMAGLKELEAFFYHQKQPYSFKELLKNCPLIYDEEVWADTMASCCFYAIIGGNIAGIIAEVPIGACMLTYVIVQLACWMIAFMAFRN